MTNGKLIACVNGPLLSIYLQPVSYCFSNFNQLWMSWYQWHPLCWIYGISYISHNLIL